MLHYRAYGGVFLPEGWTPREIKANEVIGVNEDTAAHPEFRKWVESGVLRPEPHYPVGGQIPPTVGVIWERAEPKVPSQAAEPPLEPPTVEEVLAALEKHPGLYRAVQEHFQAEMFVEFQQQWNTAQANANGDIVDLNGMQGIRRRDPRFIEYGGGVDISSVVGTSQPPPREKDEMLARLLELDSQKIEEAEEAFLTLPLSEEKPEPDPPEEPKKGLLQRLASMWGE